MDSLSRSGADSVGAYEAAAARPKTVVALSVLALALVLLAGILLRNGGPFQLHAGCALYPDGDGRADHPGAPTGSTRASRPRPPPRSSTPSCWRCCPSCRSGQFSALLVCLAATLAAARADVCGRRGDRARGRSAHHPAAGGDHRDADARLQPGRPRLRRARAFAACDADGRSRCSACCASSAPSRPTGGGWRRSPCCRCCASRRRRRWRPTCWC